MADMSFGINESVLAKRWERFTIIHKDQKVAAIRKDGTCTIYVPSFLTYDTIDGAVYQTNRKRQTQREAMHAMGLNQTTDVREEWFIDPEVRKMFFRRLDIVKSKAN